MLSLFNNCYNLEKNACHKLSILSCVCIRLLIYMVHELSTLGYIAITKIPFTADFYQNSLFLSSWIHRPSRTETQVLLFLLQSEDPSEPRGPRAALGAPPAGGRRHHRVPPDLPADARHWREQTHTDPLPKDRCERRSQLMAKHRCETSVDGVAAAAGDQLGDRNKRVRLERKRSGRYLRRSGRRGTGELSFTVYRIRISP